MTGKKGGHSSLRRANWRAKACSFRVDLVTRERMMVMIRAEWKDADTRLPTARELGEAR